MELAPGAAFGRYRIERLLGRGGMGAVYEVTDPASGRRLALKVLLAVDVPDALRRLAREARAMAAVRHPNLLAIHEVLERGEPSPSGPIPAPALVLELCPGGSLKEQLRTRGRLPWAEAARAGAQVARALAALHGAGFVHRDLKPENVLLAADGQARLADLGIVRPVAPSAQSAGPALTAAGGVIGTPGYMAPEQLQGADVDHRADLWALGCTLHALVAGAPPWTRARGVHELLERLHRERPPPLRSLAPDCPAGLEALVRRLLTVDREERPDQALAVALELEGLLARGGAGGRSRAGPALALGAAALALGGALAAATHRAPDAPASPAPGAPAPSAGAGPAPDVAPATTRDPEVTPPSPLPTLEPLRVDVEAEPGPAGALTLVVSASEPLAAVHVVPHEMLTVPKFTRDPPELEPETRRLRLLFSELPLAGVRVALFVTGRHGVVVRHDELLLASPPGLAPGPVTPVAGPRRARRARPTVVRTRRWPLPAGGALDLVWVPDAAGGGVFLGRTEVPWGTWLAYCAATGRAAPARPAWATDGHPVAGVTQDEARAFCAWAGARLPTDDELERGARGGDGRRFPWGDELPAPERATFGATAARPAGSLPGGASPWGALDLAGSVWEWVEAPEPAARGGGWSSGVEALAASSRRAPPPLEETGLRVAVDAGARPPESAPR